MAGNDPSDPLYVCNRRKLREIIRKYSNPIQDPTEADEIPVLGKDVSQTIREKSHQREKEYKEAIIKWQEFLQKYETRLKSDFTAVREKRRFVDLVYNGIPEAFRIKFWFFLLGLHDNPDEKRKKYDDIKEGSKKYAKLEDVFQIDKDVQRTFRDRAEFRKDCSQRQCMLFNVLMAYSFYNNTLGYCQGMHQCAGLLLLYLPDEQSAFWGLHKLMTARRYQLHGMFLDEFPKYIRLREEFEKILRKKNKSLYNHLMDTYAVTDTYLMLWFFTVFQADFPLSLSLRIWDIFLLQGDVIFLPMAYTLITFKEKELKKQESPKHYITNFKTILLYEETNVIEAFKRNFRAMAQNAKGPQLRIEAPENEIPKSFGLLLDREDLVSNGFDEEDEETALSNQQENEHLFKRAQETAANFPKPNRLSIFHYSPSASPSPPSNTRHRAFTEGFTKDNPTSIQDKVSNNSKLAANSSVCSLDTNKSVASHSVSAGSDFDTSEYNNHQLHIEFEKSSEVGADASKSENNLPILSTSPISDSDAELKRMTSSSNVSEELSPVSEPIPGSMKVVVEPRRRNDSSRDASASNIKSVRLIKKSNRHTISATSPDDVVNVNDKSRKSSSQKSGKIVHIRPRSNPFNQGENISENHGQPGSKDVTLELVNGEAGDSFHPQSTGSQKGVNNRVFSARSTFTFNTPSESHIPVITPYPNRAVDFKNFPSSSMRTGGSSSMLPMLDASVRPPNYPSTAAPVASSSVTSSPIALPDNKSATARYSTISASGTETRRSFISSSRSPTGNSKSKSFLLTNSLLDKPNRTSRMRVDVNRNSWGENALNSVIVNSKNNSRFSNTSGSGNNSTVANCQNILRGQLPSHHYVARTAGNSGIPSTRRSMTEKPLVGANVNELGVGLSPSHPAQDAASQSQRILLLGSEKYETEFSANGSSETSAAMNGRLNQGSMPNVNQRSSPGNLLGQRDRKGLTKDNGAHSSEGQIAVTGNGPKNGRHAKSLSADSTHNQSQSDQRKINLSNSSKIGQSNQGKATTTVSIQL